MKKQRQTGKRGSGVTSIWSRLKRGSIRWLREFLSEYAKKNPKQAVIVVPLVLLGIILSPVFLLAAIFGGLQVLFTTNPLLGSVIFIGGTASIGLHGYVRFRQRRGTPITHVGALRRLVAPIALVPQVLSSMPLINDLSHRIPSPPSILTDGGQTASDGFVVPLSESYHSELDNSTSLTPSTDQVELDRNKSVLVLGEPGAGKTTTIELLMHQMNSNPNEPVVIFDFKSEFGDTDIFEERDTKVVSIRDPDWKWNVFREAKTEGDYNEIAKKLITTDDGSGQNEFFIENARRVFEAAMIHLSRENREPTNRDLVQFFEQTQGELHEVLSTHDDLRTAAEVLGGPDDRTGKDVLSTLRPFIEEVFTGAFAEVGGFSVRNYMENPRSNVLIIQADIAQFERTKPALKFLIDWSIKYGFEDPDGYCYYVLDEFQRLPELDSIEMLANAGRGMNSQVILGLQGVTQLESSYGSEKAQAITAGTTQKIMMRPGDKQTRDLIGEAIGTEIVETRKNSDGFGNIDREQNREDYLSERDINQFQTGESVIRVPGGFVHGKVKPWSHLSDDEQQRLQSDS